MAIEWSLHKTLNSEVGLRFPFHKDRSSYAPDLVLDLHTCSPGCSSLSSVKALTMNEQTEVSVLLSSVSCSGKVPHLKVTGTSICSQVGRSVGYLGIHYYIWRPKGVLGSLMGLSPNLGVWASSEGSGVGTEEPDWIVAYSFGARELEAVDVGNPYTHFWCQKCGE